MTIDIRGALPPGAKAPPFTLPRSPERSLSLEEVLGRPVVLCFYPADWSPVCGDQLALYNELLPELQRHDATLLGLSVDGVWCHSAYARSRTLHFPLLADFEPKGGVAREYGVYVHDQGVAARALFVLDGRGFVHWSYVSPLEVNPGADGILSALEALTGRESFA
jgi:peroxiredoxin